MGTMTELCIAGYPMIYSKNSVIPDVMTIFRESDRIRNRIPYTKDLESEEETTVEYSCNVSNVIDRLNVMGFTLARAREAFENWMRSEIEHTEDCITEGDDWAQENLSVLSEFSFEQYSELVHRQIINQPEYYKFTDEQREELDPIEKFFLSAEEGIITPFAEGDLRLFIRVACEVAPRSELVIQDVTALIASGYYAENEPICDNSIRILTEGHPENSPRIILTEGSSDSEILSKSMAILYPHLTGYYSFLDFEGFRSQGGASHLVSIVKAFAAAGISNRVIAIFDNDTAASEAIRSLEQVKLPSNITIQRYPDLETLKSYPTIGPAGLVQLDVNGLAAGIELYLGTEILQESSGVFTPVQWKGYSELMRQYQGEVMQKSRLKHAFFEKAEKCMLNSACIKSADWSGVDAILKQIFSAFE